MKLALVILSLGLFYGVTATAGFTGRDDSGFCLMPASGGTLLSQRC